MYLPLLSSPPPFPPHLRTSFFLSSSSSPPPPPSTSITTTSSRRRRMMAPSSCAMRIGAGTSPIYSWASSSPPLWYERRGDGPPLPATLRRSSSIDSPAAAAASVEIPPPASVIGLSSPPLSLCGRSVCRKWRRAARAGATSWCSLGGMRTQGATASSRHGPATPNYGSRYTEKGGERRRG